MSLHGLRNIDPSDPASWLFFADYFITHIEPNGLTFESVKLST